MPSHLRLMMFDKDTVEEREDIPLTEAIELAKGPHIGWVSLYGPTEDDFAQLEELLGLHPLALEDCRNQRQRPKIEEYPGNTYIVARSLHREADGELSDHQSNLFFGTGWVVVIHDRPLGVFDVVRDRIRRGRPRIRTAGADYLVYSLLDAIVDTYFPILEDLGDKIETIEEQLEDGSDQEDLEKIHDLKGDLRIVRHTAWPARDALAGLVREETAGFKRATQPFLRDVYDHAVRAIDISENHRETVSALMDLYHTMVQHRTNEVMKVLTIVATVFIPITFFASIYGMNFEHMPELEKTWGYPTFLAIALLVVVGELWFFRRRGWF